MSKTRLRRTDDEKERYWREVVRGQGGSGQSVREYCRQVGVKESAFYWWRRELARRQSAVREVARSQRPAQRKPARSSAVRGQAGQSGPQRTPGRGQAGAETPPGGGSTGNEASSFVPIHLLADSRPANGAGVEIYLGDGRTIRVRPGFDRQTLCEVLALLEGRPC